MRVSHVPTWVIKYARWITLDGACTFIQLSRASNHIKFKYDGRMGISASTKRTGALGHMLVAEALSGKELELQKLRLLTICVGDDPRHFRNVLRYRSAHAGERTSRLEFLQENPTAETTQWDVWNVPLLCERASRGRLQACRRRMLIGSSWMNG